MKLHRLLKPSGILVIEVPNVEATCQAPQNTFHEAHIFNFNLSTLQKLAEKTGFTGIGQLTSDDGGNITLFARKNAEKNGAPAALAIPGNAESIIRIVRGHTPLKHYTTAHPYRRLWHRLRQYFAEQYGTRDFTSGKALLDQLYAPTHPPARTPRHTASGTSMSNPADDPVQELGHSLHETPHQPAGLTTPSNRRRGVSCFSTPAFSPPMVFIATSR